MGDILESMKRYTYDEIPEGKLFSYILGFIMADGYVNKSGLSISLQERDKAFLACIASFFQQFGYRPKWNVRTIKGKKYHRMRLHSVNLSHLLNSYGIFQGKSLTKTFPENIPYIDAYLAGYFDGNGSVILHKGYLELQFHSGSEQFLRKALHNVEILLGKELGRTIKKHRGAWRFTLYGEDAVYIGNLFYNNKEFRLPRKRDKVLEYKKPELSSYFWRENGDQFVLDTKDLPIQYVADKLNRSYKSISKRRWLLRDET